LSWSGSQTLNFKREKKSCYIPFMLFGPRLTQKPLAIFSKVDNCNSAIPLSNFKVN